MQRLLTGVSPNLLSCMNDVYLRGCERAYLGPGLDKETICPKQDPATQTGAGTLVMHIRSGDILMGRPKDGRALYPGYGQVLSPDKTHILQTSLYGEPASRAHW